MAAARLRQEAAAGVESPHHARAGGYDDFPSPYLHDAGFAAPRGHQGAPLQRGEHPQRYVHHAPRRGNDAGGVVGYVGLGGDNMSGNDPIPENRLQRARQTSLFRLFSEH